MTICSNCQQSISEANSSRPGCSWTHSQKDTQAQPPDGFSISFVCIQMCAWSVQVHMWRRQPPVTPEALSTFAAAVLCNRVSPEPRTHRTGCVSHRAPGSNFNCCPSRHTWLSLSCQHWIWRPVSGLQACKTSPFPNSLPHQASKSI